MVKDKKEVFDHLERILENILKRSLSCKIVS